MKKLMVILSITLIATAVYMAFAQRETPEVIGYIEEQGVTILDTFDAPSGLKGYVGMANGQPMSIYLTEDRQYALIGSLINADGKDLSDDILYELVSKPQDEKIWKELEQANWIQDGQTSAKNIIYTFTDPYCPYCQRFRNQAASSIEDGTVQLRHIMVGILHENSVSKSASLFAAVSPAEALQQHFLHHDQQANLTFEEMDDSGKKQVEENNHLMEQLGLMATPATVYRDDDGKIHLIEGMPTRKDIKQMFES